MKYQPNRRLVMLLLAAFVIALALPLGAQTTLADPNDPIYAQFDAWATRGLLRNLPRLRPYTVAMTIGLLKEVAVAGGEADARVASGYLEVLRDSALRIRSDVRALAALSSSGRSYMAMAAPGASYTGLLAEGLGASARVEGWLTKNYPDAVTPYGTRFDRDPLFGSGSSLGAGTDIAQDLVSDLSYGSEGLGIQAGYMRGSWGPIYSNGVVVGPQSPQSGQLTFSLRSPSLTADIGFFMLQQGWPDAMGIKDKASKEIGFSSSKFMMIHGANWSPAPWLELGFFESMVWVGRIEPLYFLPLSELFLSQSVAGYSDNAFMGLSSSVYLPADLKLDLVGYVDDLAFSTILKGTWDTNWKVAAQACLSWAPQSPVLQRLSLDYTAVTPYTYTHWEDAGSSVAGNAYNGALAYTNAGKNLGPALDPNSDRVTLQADSVNIGGARLSGVLRLIRHGNASAGVTVGGTPYDATTNASGDASGDLGDSGVYSPGLLLGWIFQGDKPTGTSPRYFRFLTQSVIQVSAQAGFDLTYQLPIERLGTLDLGLGYLFEYMANADLVAGATSAKHYLSFKAGLQL